jgi:iron complex transport system ATP-binding protein
MTGHKHGTGANAPPAGPYGQSVGEAVLAARQVTVRRGHRTVLTDVNVAVRAGELLALVGPNGAGKSTLLAALVGEVDVASGQITVDGWPLPAWRPVELARRRALLPQRNTVAFGFTVREVVAMGRWPWLGTELSTQDDEVVGGTLRDVGVEAAADRSFHELSGGEQARVALARVLAQRTGILLLDEPTAALDIRHQELVMALAAKRAREGSAVVVVMHDLGLAAAYADRVVLLNEGSVVGDGPPAQVLTAIALSEVYQHPIRTATDPVSGAVLVHPVRSEPDRS